MINETNNHFADWISIAQPVTADVSGVTVILTEHYLGLMRTTEEAQTLLYLESDATNATAG